MEFKEIESEAKEDSLPQDESALLQYLAHITPEDLDRMISIVRNRYNEDPQATSKSMTDYYDLVRSVFNNNINTVGNSTHTRNQRYEIYDEMDESVAYISSALDILSDDATQADEDGIIIHVQSDSTKVLNVVNEFLEEFEIEDKISKWAKTRARRRFRTSSGFRTRRKAR